MMLKKSDSLILDEEHAKAAHANGKMKQKVYGKELQQLLHALRKLLRAPVSPRTGSRIGRVLRRFSAFWRRAHARKH